MKRKIAYLILVVCIIGIICILTKKMWNENNKIDYSNLEFNTVNISESKLNRYNELINIPEVSLLIRDLPSVLEEDVLNEQIAISYCYCFAGAFKENSTQYIINNKDKAYIDCNYTEEIIYELFGKTVTLDYYRDDNDYLFVNTSNISTDAISLKVNEISYNKGHDLYKIAIQEDYGQDDGNIIKIIYEYKEGKYTLLWCLSEVKNR